MFSGTVFLTDNIEVVMQIPMDGSTKVIDMDEENSLPSSPHIIKGTCLLPPIEAKIAEVDGDENKYNAIYAAHLTDRYQQTYITALLAYIYMGGNLIIYLPEEQGYTNTEEKFCEHMLREYGIHIGIIGDSVDNAQCFYDYHYIPFWLNLLYKANIIDPETFLLQYPLDANLAIDQEVVNKLLGDMRPFGGNLEEKIAHIYEFHKKIHINPKLQDAIQALE